MVKTRTTALGLTMTQPRLKVNGYSLSPDTVFRVNNEKVVLNGPNSYYEYTQQVPVGDINYQPATKTVTRLGNDPKVINNFRKEVLAGEKANDYTSWVLNLWNGIKTLFKKDGGHINYVTYAQSGAELQQGQQQLLKMIEAFKSDPKKVLASLSEEEIPSFIQAMKNAATELGDEELGSIAESIAEELQIFKCGGAVKKVRKAVKKACGGKKLETGSIIKPTCPCKLHRIGGQLVEIDCEGRVISKHQTGGTATYLVGPMGDLELSSPEVKMDRMTKYGAPSTRGISYNYVPGEVHHLSGINPGRVSVNTNTGRYIKNGNGVYLPDASLTTESTQFGYNKYNSPDQDVYRFPDGTVIRKQNSTVLPEFNSFPGSVPVMKPDNTSTVNSSLHTDWGNANGGIYSTGIQNESVPANYTPEEWQEVHDQVNGQVRKSWKNTKNGDLTRVQPKGKILPAKAKGGTIQKFLPGGTVSGNTETMPGYGQNSAQSKVKPLIPRIQNWWGSLFDGTSNTTYKPSTYTTTGVVSVGGGNVATMPGYGQNSAQSKVKPLFRNSNTQNTSVTPDRAVVKTAPVENPAAAVTPKPESTVNTSVAAPKAELSVAKASKIENKLSVQKEESPSNYTGLFSGNLRSMSARQQWLKDNYDYMKAQGWDDARINNYNGSATDNVALSKLLGGAQNWYDQRRVNTPAMSVSKPSMEVAPISIPTVSIKPNTPVINTPEVNSIPSVLEEDTAFDNYMNNMGRLKQERYDRALNAMLDIPQFAHAHYGDTNTPQSVGINENNARYLINANMVGGDRRRALRLVNKGYLGDILNAYAH